MPRRKTALGRELAGLLTVLVMQAPWSAPAQSVREPVRVTTGSITAIGDAEPGELRKLVEAAAAARATLGVLAPSTESVFYPLIFFVECRGNSASPAIHEQPWGLYVVLRCGSRLDGTDGIERHARLILGQAVRSLPLWLEVGSARLASRGRVRDGTVLIGQPEASDVASHRWRPLAVRDVLAASRERDVWTDASLQSRFVRQAWIYTRYLAATGALATCLDWPADSLTPEVELRRCLATDIDGFHSLAVESWVEGAKNVSVPNPPPVGAVTSSRVSDAEFQAARLDVLLAVGEPRMGRKEWRRWLPADQQHPEVVAAAGRLKLAVGEVSAGLADLERSLSLEFDPMVAYHYASALLRPAFRADSISALPTQDGAKAEALLSQVVEVLPLADALALQGMARLGSGDAGGAVQSLSAAARAWPRHDYVLWLARALASSRQTAAARRTAQSLVEVGEPQALRERARALMRHLPDGDDEAGPIDVLPPLRAGERRARGRLMRVECRDGWTELILEEQAGHLVRVATARLSLASLTYFGTPPAPLRCGARDTPEPVVITWRPDERRPQGSLGILVAVAFVAEPDVR